MCCQKILQRDIASKMSPAQANMTIYVKCPDRRASEVAAAA